MTNTSTTSGLEARIAKALTNPNVDSATLTECLTETNEAIDGVERAAQEAKARAHDPSLSADPIAALQDMQLAEIQASRLVNSRALLADHLFVVLERERAERWDVEYRRGSAVIEQAAERFVEARDLIRRLASLYAETVEIDKMAFAVNANAMAGEVRQLPTVEQAARKLPAFSRDQPSLLERTVLLDFDNSGDRLWPPSQRLDPTLFQPALPSKATTPRWWEAAAEREQQQRDAIAAEQDANEREKQSFYGQTRS